MEVLKPLRERDPNMLRAVLPEFGPLIIQAPVPFATPVRDNFQLILTKLSIFNHTPPFQQEVAKYGTGPVTWNKRRTEVFYTNPIIEG